MAVTALHCTIQQELLEIWGTASIKPLLNGVLDWSSHFCRLGWFLATHIWIFLLKWSKCWSVTYLTCGIYPNFLTTFLWAFEGVIEQPQFKLWLQELKHYEETKKMKLGLLGFVISGHVTEMFSWGDVVKRSQNCPNEPWMIYGLPGQKQKDLKCSRLLSTDRKQHSENFEQSKLARWANLLNFPWETHTSGLLGMLCRCWVKFDFTGKVCVSFTCLPCVYWVVVGF